MAINRAEPATTAERFLSEIKVSEHVTLILDPEDRYYESIGGFAMPETIFYDREGNMTHHNHGVIKLEDMRKYVDAALLVSD